MAMQSAKSQHSEEGKSRPKGKGGEGSKPQKEGKSKAKAKPRAVPKIHNGHINHQKKKNGHKQNGNVPIKKRVARSSVESKEPVNKRKNNDKGGVISEPYSARPSQVKRFRQRQEKEAKAEELPLDVVIPPMNQEVDDIEVAQDKVLPSSPDSKPNGAPNIPKAMVDNFDVDVDDEGGGAMAEGGVLSDDDDDDIDEEEFYRDGNETTAPGLLAQVWLNYM